jgi:Holliday junction resolvasome RuvABC endonuclease subunit
MASGVSGVSMISGTYETPETPSPKGDCLQLRRFGTQGAEEPEKIKGEKILILGLDMATKTGWCILQDGQVIASGVQDFSKRRGESNGILFLRFRKWLLDLLNTVPEKPMVIAYEGAHFRGGAPTEVCVGLQTHCQSIAAELGIESTRVHTMTLKKYACGTGKANKVAMMKIAARFLGREPIDDNEADAVHLARWAECEFLPF